MWIFNNQTFNLQDHSEAFAFVYIIRNLLTGKQYIGQKQFYTFKYKTINKKRKKVKVESDWKNYWSSSENLKHDIEVYGVNNFEREILHLCVSKGTVNYAEAKEQFDRRVLEHPDLYYNGIINIRCNRSHLKL